MLAVPEGIRNDPEPVVKLLPSAALELLEAVKLR